MGGNFVASLAIVTSSGESFVCWSSLVICRMTQNVLVGNCFAYLLLEMHAAESFLGNRGWFKYVGNRDVYYRVYKVRSLCTVILTPSLLKKLFSLCRVLLSLSSVIFFCVGFPTNFEHACVNVSNYDNQQHLLRSVHSKAPATGKVYTKGTVMWRKRRGVKAHF